MSTFGKVFSYFCAARLRSRDTFAICQFPLSTFGKVFQMFRRYHISNCSEGFFKRSEGFSNFKRSSEFKFQMFRRFFLTIYFATLSNDTPVFFIFLRPPAAWHFQYLWPTNSIFSLCQFPCQLSGKLYFVEETLFKAPLFKAEETLADPLFSSCQWALSVTFPVCFISNKSFDNICWDMINFDQLASLLFPKPKHNGMSIWRMISQNARNSTRKNKESRFSSNLPFLIDDSHPNLHMFLVLLLLSPHCVQSILVRANALRKNRFFGPIDREKVYDCLSHLCCQIFMFCFSLGQLVNYVSKPRSQWCTISIPDTCESRSSGVWNRIIYTHAHHICDFSFLCHIHYVTCR